MPHPSKPSLEDLRTRLSTAGSMLDHGLGAIHRGSCMDAMEAVYAASCLIEEILAALETGAGVEKSELLFNTPTGRPRVIARVARSGH